MNILTLETTCDETAAAIVTDRLEVLASTVASQDDLHERFGGVVPEIASRAHVERILPVGHDHTDVVYDYFAAPGTDGEIDAMVEMSNVVLDEDQAICEAVQRNLDKKDDEC